MSEPVGVDALSAYGKWIEEWDVPRVGISGSFICFAAGAKWAAGELEETTQPPTLSREELAEALYEEMPHYRPVEGARGLLEAINAALPAGWFRVSEKLGDPQP